MSNFISISDARARLPKLVDKVEKELERVIITVQGRPKVIIMSADELESLEETAEVLSIPGAKKSIKTGLEQAKKRKGISLAELK